jgi:hypothetical protein
MLIDPIEYKKLTRSEMYEKITKEFSKMSKPQMYKMITGIDHPSIYLDDEWKILDEESEIFKDLLEKCYYFLEFLLQITEHKKAVERTECCENVWHLDFVLLMKMTRAGFQIKEFGVCRSCGNIVEVQKLKENKKICKMCNKEFYALSSYPNEEDLCANCKLPF